MQRSSQEIDTYEEDEINLSKLFGELLAKRNFIFASTVVLTFLAIIYVFNIEPTYKASSSFTSPDDSSIIYVNQILNNSFSDSMENEISSVLFSRFLTLLSSPDTHKEIFIDGEYLNRIKSKDNYSVTDENNFISSFISTIKVSSPKKTEKQQKLGFLTELPYSISIQGSDPIILSDFLNDVVEKSNLKTIANLSTSILLKNKLLLDEISSELEYLLIEAKEDRLFEIIRIEANNIQLIKEINDQIFREREKIEQERLVTIERLTESAKLAKSLGIIENNFKEINQADVNIALSGNTIFDGSIPEWYLYGEKALLEQIKILSSRLNDEFFSNEIVKLNNDLHKVKNNNFLQTLKARKDDGPFIEKFNELKMKKIKIKSLIVDLSKVNSMQISKHSLPPKSSIKPKKRRLLFLLFIGSFMLSIMLALFLKSKKVA